MLHTSLFPGVICFWSHGFHWAAFSDAESEPNFLVSLFRFNHFLYTPIDILGTGKGTKENPCFLRNKLDFCSVSLNTCSPTAKQKVDQMGQV